VVPPPPPSPPPNLFGSAWQWAQPPPAGTAPAIPDQTPATNKVNTAVAPGQAPSMAEITAAIKQKMMGNVAGRKADAAEADDAESCKAGEDSEPEPHAKKATGRNANKHP